MGVSLLYKYTNKTRCTLAKREKETKEIHRIKKQFFDKAHKTNAKNSFKMCRKIVKKKVLSFNY